MKKKIDNLGRIGIPKPIREAMAIKKEALFLSAIIHTSTKSHCEKRKIFALLAEIPSILKKWVKFSFVKTASTN